MKYGFVLPLGDARTAASLAVELENAGWDGLFVWEPVWGIDAWVLLTAAAMVTRRIRLGTMLTPISRMRPWKLASETATVDNLSNGRVILSIGLGAVDTGFTEFGEVTDRKTRAELVDEGLDVLTGLWSGQPFNYNGKHYQIKETQFYPPPPPVQKPRIPIWVVGAWPRPKSIRRVLKYDGLIPSKIDENGKTVQATPEDIQAMKTYIEENRQADTPFDIIVEGTTPGDQPEKASGIIQPWADAGATWWIEGMWSAMDQPNGHQIVIERVRQGPPRIETA